MPTVERREFETSSTFLAPNGRSDNSLRCLYSSTKRFSPAKA